LRGACRATPLLIIGSDGIGDAFLLTWIIDQRYSFGEVRDMNAELKGE